MRIQPNIKYNTFTVSIGMTLIALLTILSVTYPPYTMAAVILLIPAVYLLINKPDLAFALYFSIQTLFF
jgi:heme/copper-type cytochrome/quinol oxidase subunit 4